MIRLFIALVFFAVLVFPDPLRSQHYLIPSRFAESPSPPKPDYNDQNNWCALPHRVDEADQAPRGHQPVGMHALADVFYVHPTLFFR